MIQPIQSNSNTTDVASARKIDPIGRRVGLQKKYASCREMRSAKIAATLSSSSSSSPLKHTSIYGNSSMSATCMDSSSDSEDECEQIIHETIAKIDGTSPQQPPVVVVGGKRSDHLTAGKRRSMDQLLNEIDDICGTDVGW